MTLSKACGSLLACLCVAGAPGLAVAQAVCTQLYDRYDSLGSLDPAAAAAQRAWLTEAMRRAGCQGGKSAERAQWDEMVGGARNPEVFEELYQEQRRIRSPHRARQESEDSSDDDMGFGGGTYRTLCVRFCDGYYWPISYSTTQRHFSADEQLCRASCPAQAVALYVHRNPGEESDSAISLKGEAYTALPAAFYFRTSYQKSCSCRGPQPGFADEQTIAGTAMPKLQTPAAENSSQFETLSTPGPSGKREIVNRNGSSEVEIITTPATPIIVIDPNYVPEKSNGPNGLRGVSPVPLQDPSAAEAPPSPARGLRR